MTSQNMQGGAGSRLSRRGRAGLAPVAAFLAILASSELRAQDAPADVTQSWTVISVSGTVEQLPALDAWRDALLLAPGNLVAPSHVVATHPASEAILMRAGDIVVVYANAAVRLPEPRTSIRGARADQIMGDVLYLIAPGEGGPFEVVTPYFVVGVRGTRFLVTDFGRRAVVTEGRVLVTALKSGAAVEVNGGSQAFVGDPAASTVLVSRVPGEAINLWETKAAKIRLGAAAPR